MARNLLYHITPMGAYRWNIAQLQKRLHIFDGQCFIAVAQGKGFDPIEKVRRMFPSHVMLFPVPNDKELRETASFPLLLDQIEKTSSDDITFYGHTKGVTHGSDPAVKLWTEALYYLNLDLIKQVEELFQKQDASMVGSLVRHGVFEHMPAKSKWHYSGTFFWFKNDKLFAKKNWKEVPKLKYGVEGWPSLVCKFGKEAQVVFGPTITDLYKMSYLTRILGPTLIKEIRKKCTI